MNIPAPSSTALRSLLLAGVFAVLHGCSGDARPLTEAVEVEELGLESLQIQPPARSIEDPEFSVSTGQQVQFTLIANGGEGDLEVDATDRRWRVSDSSVASIDDDGLLTGRTAGPAPVEVSVAIGDIVADAYAVRVSDAPLAQFDELVGDVEPEPCLPENYVIAGSFADGTRRLVPDVRWELGDEVDADLVTEGDGSASVSAKGSGALTLSASAGDVTPFVTLLNIADTLSSITIEPATDPLAVNVDAAIDLLARGQYARGDGATTAPDAVSTANDSTTPEDATASDANTLAIDITDNVDWSITAGGQYASIDNEPTGDRGRLRGRAAGSATVQVACGVAVDPAMRQVSVSQSSTDTGSATSLVFQQTDPLRLGIGDSVRLRVATGSVFSAANEVTTGVRFTTDNSGVVSLSDSTVNDGFGTTSGGFGTTTGGIGTTTGGSGTTITTTVGIGTTATTGTGTINGTVFTDGDNGSGSGLFNDDTPLNNVVTGLVAGRATVSATLDNGTRADITIDVQ